MWIQSLDWDDPLEKEMATHSIVPAWRNLWTEKQATVHGIIKSRTRLKRLSTHVS